MAMPVDVYVSDIAYGPSRAGRGRWLTAVDLVVVVALAAAGLALAHRTPLTSPPLVRLSGGALDLLKQPGVASTPATAAEQNEPIAVTVTLNRSNQTGFDRYLADVENPASRNYRHFLTQSQLTQRFGPSKTAYDHVRAYLRGHGLTPVQDSANRLTITARGSRHRVEDAFGVHIQDHVVSGRSFFANAESPGLPGSIAPLVQAISGLSNLATPQVPLVDKKKFADNICRNRIFSTEGGVATGIALIFGGVFAIVVAIVLTAICLGLWYGVSLQESGFFSGKVSPGPGALGARAGAVAPPKIGLLEFDSFKPGDVANWLSLIGLDPNIAQRVSVVPVNGGVSPGAGESEVLLDIDTAITTSAKSGAQIVVYEAPLVTTYQQIFNAMIADNVTIISNSWSSCEDQVSAADARSIDSVLAQAAASGISVFNGSGDSGSTCLDGSRNTIGVPADSPHATSVGATTPKFGAGYNYGGETPWDETKSHTGSGQSGFGTSKYFAAPTYQAGVTTSGMRSIPDVVFDGDPAAGIAICQEDAGGCPTGALFGGTSMAAPALAGLAAVLGQKLGANLGEINPSWYRFAGTTAFHSAASMNSDFAHVGLGSPDLAHLLLGLSGQQVGPVDNANSTVRAGGPVPADGSTTSFVQAGLHDRQGFPVAGKTVTATVTGHAVLTPASGLTGSDGVAVFTVTDSVAETVTFTMADATDGITLSSTSSMTFVPPSATGASIIASPATVPNDGTSKATITVYLEDGLHRPASGKTVSLSAGSSNASISPSGLQAVTDSAGQATFTATDTASETVLFTATDVTDNNLPVPGNAVVNFTTATTPCNNAIPTPVAGFSATPFVTGFAFRTSTIVYPGNVTSGPCGTPSPPAFDSSGNAYVANQTDGSIHVFGPSGGVATAANRLPGASFGPDSIGGLVFGKDGSLYAGLINLATNIRAPEIVQLDPATGATIRVVASAATGLPDCPYSLAIDPLSGDLFTDDECSGYAASNQVSRITNPASANPTVSNYVTTSGGNLGLAFAPDGTLYLAHADADSTIQQIGGTNTASPTVTTVAHVPSGATGIAASVAVASVGPSGHATALDVFTFGGTVSQIDLTQTPPTVTTVASGNSSSFFIQATSAGGCVYASTAGTVIRFGPTSCGSSPPTTTGPQITLTGSGLASPPTGSPVTFTAGLVNFPAPPGTPVRFTVTGANPQVKLVRADATGAATFSYAGVFPGTDTVTAFAPVGDATITSAPLRFRWVAGRHTSSISLNQSQSAGPSGNPATLTANLVDVSQTPPTPISGAAISIGLGDQSCTATTDANGIGACTLTPTGPPRLLTTRADYAGSSTFTASTDTNSFSVWAARSAVGSTATAVTSSTNPSGLGEAVTFSASVTGSGGTPTGTVQFLDGAANLGSPVALSGGVATLSVSSLGLGTHSITAVYSGDGSFAGSTSAPLNQVVTASFTCDAAHTITGRVSATTLTPGRWCVTNAMVAGLTVQPGAAVSITTSQIVGPLTSTGATSFRMCGSQVSKGLTVSGSTGFVLVGDTGDDACARNDVSGSVTLSNNTGGLDVANDRITGDLTVTNTSGRGPLADNTAPLVAANQVNGALACSGNVPSPTNGGRPNSVTGAKTGQCAGL